MAVAMPQRWHSTWYGESILENFVFNLKIPFEILIFFWKMTDTTSQIREQMSGPEIS